MSDKQSNLTDKEMEDLQSIVTDTLASVCAMADKNNIDRDSMLKYFADMLTAFAEVASIQNYETNDMAIQALEEVQQYREIGTLEECQTAREKQMPKKPYHISQVDDNDNANVECPACHATADYAVNVIKRGHCWKCGQLLDWSDDNETN